MNEITSDLKGIYVSEQDSLFLTDNEYVLSDTIEKYVGKWELMDNDNLSVHLIDEQNRTTELKITYKDGKPELTDEKRSYIKIN